MLYLITCQVTVHNLTGRFYVICRKNLPVKLWTFTWHITLQLLYSLLQGIPFKRINKKLLFITCQLFCHYNCQIIDRRKCQVLENYIDYSNHSVNTKSCDFLTFWPHPPPCHNIWTQKNSKKTSQIPIPTLPSNRVT